MKALEGAYEERNGRLVNLGVHPQFAFLRAEPGFQKLLQQIGLTAASQKGKSSASPAIPKL